MPKLTVSMLCLNRVELTQRCVESILANTTDFELRILDNGSTDATPAYLKSLVRAHPNVFAIREEKNIGFITGHNTIARQARGAYVCVLNNDVEVGPGWADGLIGPLDQDPGLGATGPVDDYGFLSDQMVGRRGPEWGTVEYLSGHCLMVPKWVIDRFGLFDETELTWATGEDSDFSLRLRRAGYRIRVLKDVKVAHMKRATMDHVSNELLGYDPVQNELRNRQVLTRRWGGYLRTRRFEALRIFVGRAGAMGDVLCVEPTLRALKQYYPSSHLTFLTQMGGAVYGCPVIDRFTNVTAVKNERYDLAFDLDLAYERRPTIHIVDAYADVCGVKPQGRPQFYLTAEGQAMAARAPMDRPLVIIAAEGSWPIRQWPAERFREVAQRLTKWFRVVEVGSAKGGLGVGWNLCGKTTLQQLAGLYSQASLAVMCDSLHVHLAACFHTPTVGIWGGTNPLMRIHGPEHRVVRRTDFPCVGCHHEREAPRCHTHCDQGAFRQLHVPANGCMDIPVTDVVRAIEETIEGRPSV